MHLSINLAKIGVQMKNTNTKVCIFSFFNAIEEFETEFLI
jgi:hypothetical protein